MQCEPETSHERLVYANFVFPEKSPALYFAQLIAGDEWTASVTYATDREQWRVTVQRKIQILHREITVWLAFLTTRAGPLGGDYDGWGKMPPA